MRKHLGLPNAMTLGSFICVRNGFELDYCWELAAESLLKVCDQLVLCDSDSTDGTREAMERMADKNPRIKVVNWPWPKPVRDSHHWFLRWLRFAQSHLTTDYCFYLDADEVLDDSPRCHQALKAAAARGDCIAVDRLNYWRDAQSLVPDGHCCGKWCIRGGPTQYPVVSDEPHHAGEELIVDHAEREPAVVIHHLGFLRKRDAFYAKAKVVLEGWFGRYDPRLEKGEQDGKQLWETECEFTDLLVPFHGYQPDAVERWLSDRGHLTTRFVPMTEQEAYKRVRITDPDPNQPMNVLVVGDFGDIIHGLPILKALPKGARLFARDANHICKRLVHRMSLIGPLLEKQDYIIEFREHHDEDIHWNAGDFRTHHDTEKSLAWAHWQHYQGQRSLPRILPDFINPWLSNITPDPRGDQRIIINRTDRYQNRHFRWQDIVNHYNTALLFVGTREEHSAFTSRYGAVEYLPTENLLEVAQLIAASPLFIGNQSACFAIAEGMKHRRVLEACLWQPDVMVAKEPNFLPCGDGALELPPLCNRPPLRCPPNITKVDYLRNPANQPRTGWQLENMRDVSYSMLKRQVKRKYRDWDDQKIHKAIYDALAEREPSYFSNGSQQTELSKFKAALENAL